MIDRTKLWKCKGESKMKNVRFLCCRISDPIHSCTLSPWPHPQIISKNVVAGSSQTPIYYTCC